MSGSACFAKTPSALLRLTIHASETDAFVHDVPDNSPAFAGSCCPTEGLRDPGTGSQDRLCQHPVGGAAGARGASQTRNQHLGADRLSVDAETEKAAFKLVVWVPCRIDRRILATGTHQDPLTAIRLSSGERQACVPSEMGDISRICPSHVRHPRAPLKNNSLSSLMKPFSESPGIKRNYCLEAPP